METGYLNTFRLQKGLAGLIFGNRGKFNAFAVIPFNNRRTTLFWPRALFPEPSGQ
jgi:hypothetical protein